VTAGLFAAGVINENAPHGFSGGGEKVGAAIEVRIFAAYQTHPGFMHQGGGLKRMAWGFPRHSIRRQLP
jgi:hypothetical protein